MNLKKHWGSISMSAALAALALGSGAAQSVHAQTFTVLYNFMDDTDGAIPYASLVRDGAGNLYGTTYQGGGASRWGTVFKVDTNGDETVLHSFNGRTKDGQFPNAGLVQDSEGNLYGTTTEGGASNQGTVFEVDSNGNETVLHSFPSGRRDGRSPGAGSLVQDAKGNLYGTTNDGGGTTCHPAHGCGTIFRLHATGKENLLYRFDRSDGETPDGVILDLAGNLYGVTADGGDLNCGGGYGCGVVYKLSKEGKLTVLHEFSGGTADGCYPVGSPTLDASGNLYGTTELCGASEAGIVWMVSNAGTETVLHSFSGDATDGNFPQSGVILDTTGNLYGVTAFGGASNLGTIYELDASGTVTLLHSFAGSDGSYPFGAMIQDAEGNFYGTSSAGGSGPCREGCGTVWTLTP